MKDIVLKEEVLRHYSADRLACIWCGFDDIRALCIDHIDGDNKYYPNKKLGVILYRWLKANNYPDGYQTLCFNCNHIKAVENKEQGISGELRKCTIEARLTKEKRAYNLQTAQALPQEIGMEFLANYIKSQGFYRFTLQEVYNRLGLGESKQTLLRATCLKMIREGRLRRLGKGSYEKITVGVNS